ncbi:MAG: hypothetical protein HY010_16585 [Acidobacteria bacterium]|nr:hypothetical protein [Acidobacteriota bacterium]
MGNIEMAASPVMDARPSCTSGKIMLRLFRFKVKINTDTAVAPPVAMPKALAHSCFGLELDVTDAKV